MRFRLAVWIQGFNDEVFGCIRAWWDRPLVEVMRVSPRFRRIREWWRTWRYGPEYTILVDEVEIAKVRTKKASLDVDISPGTICGRGKVTVLGPKPVKLKVTVYSEAV